MFRVPQRGRDVKMSGRSRGEGVGHVEGRGRSSPHIRGHRHESGGGCCCCCCCHGSDGSRAISHHCRGQRLEQTEKKKRRRRKIRLSFSDKHHGGQQIFYLRSGESLPLHSGFRLHQPTWPSQNWL